MARKTIDLQSLGALETQVDVVIATIQSPDSQLSWLNRLAAGEKPGQKTGRGTL